VTGAVGVVDREPLLVPACGRSEICESVATIERAPHIIEKRLEKAEIEKTAGIIATQDRVAAEDVVFENAGERPGHTPIGGVSIAALPEVGSNAVELSPTDHDPVVICWVDRDGTLISRVAHNVLAVAVNINLSTRERTFLRDHSR